jgi:aminopeptidase-like protein
MRNTQKAKITGKQMYAWANDLFPITRSITGPGVRKTLAYLKDILPDLTIHEVSSGTKAFDWTVPDEWIIRNAFIEDDFGNKIIDFKDHNLHVMGYSEPVDKWLDLEELEEHLHSLPDQPNAIPYITSYYQRRWGFCLTHNQRLALKTGRYHVVIDSELKPGVLNYGELIIPGSSGKEVLLSTYICHPSMANNEISGIVVTAALAEWLLSLENNRYTYRILFVPETIGSIVYLSRNAEIMKKNTVAGYVITCVGDNQNYSYLASRKGDTLADRVAKYALNNYTSGFASYSFLERGSDERQYGSPLINLPVASIMRTKYGEYPEYHTSLDNMSFISPEGLEGSVNIFMQCILILEANIKYMVTVSCEPQFGKRGLYPTLSTKETDWDVRAMENLMVYCDGEFDLLSIASIIKVDIMKCNNIAKKLENKGLLVKKMT